MLQSCYWACKAFSVCFMRALTLPETFVLNAGGESKAQEHLVMAILLVTAHDLKQFTRS